MAEYRLNGLALLNRYLIFHKDKHEDIELIVNNSLKKKLRIMQLENILPLVR